MLLWDILVTRISKISKNTKLVRITSAGLNESHVHGISITRESPNYQTNK